MKKKVIEVLMCLIVAVLCSNVYATFNGNFLLKYSSKTIQTGKTITVTLNVNNISDTEKGVETIEGYINIDENIFEPLTVNSIQTNEDGKVVIGTQELTVEDLTNKTNADSINSEGVSFNGNPISDNDAKIIIDLPTPIKEDTDVLTIEFKVKENATIGEAEDAIKYDMFVMYSGTDMTNYSQSSLSFTIEENTEDKDQDEGNSEHEHSWKENTSKSKAATCTEDGYKYYECTVTGCTETKKETVTAAGHKYGDWKVTKEATVSAEGEQTRTCSVCGTKDTKSIAKLQASGTNDSGSSGNSGSSGSGTSVGASVQGSSSDTTTAKTVLPNTGIKRVILPVVILIVAVYVSYRKYMKYKDI
jgi:hypothetical protein